MLFVEDLSGEERTRSKSDMQGVQGLTPNKPESFAPQSDGIYRVL
jgi:hypothetical protein